MRDSRDMTRNHNGFKAVDKTRTTSSKAATIARKRQRAVKQASQGR